MAKTKYYLTTPIHDATSEPDLGTLYTAILCDAIARHKRMCAFDVATFIGTDTRGWSVAPWEESAGDARAASLQRKFKKFEGLLNLVDVRCTHFQGTESAENIRGVQTLLRRILRRSQQAIYEAPYEGRYCPHDQVDVSESAEPANCAICGRAADLISEERYFFRLSAFQGQLLALYEYRREFVQPSFRLDEMRSVVGGGLTDIAISRRASERGIPWPDDADRMVSACCAELASYLSGIGFGEGGYGSEEFKRYWPANLHVIGEGALRSHAIVWTALLMAADLPAPRHIFAHGTLKLEQEGTDKTLFPEATVQALGSDAVRYYLLREVGYGENARVSSGGLVRRCNVDLAEGLAGLANRILALVARHCDGKIPTESLLAGMDRRVEIVSRHTQAEVRFLLDSFNFSEAIEKISSLVAMIDKLLRDNAGLELADDSSAKRRFSDILHDACEELGWIALLLHPILPRATAAIWRSLGQTTRLEDQLLDETPWSCLLPGTPIGKLEGLFPVVEDLPSMGLPRPEIRPQPSD
jgi:methionyl-tRNA synthetase